MPLDALLQIRIGADLKRDLERVAQLHRWSTGAAARVLLERAVVTELGPRPPRPPVPIALGAECHITVTSAHASDPVLRRELHDRTLADARERLGDEAVITVVVEPPR